MHSGMFYRRGASLTNAPVGEGTSTGNREAETAHGESAFGGFQSIYPDPTFAIHQKLDAIVDLFDKHKAETRAENAQLKEKIGGLGSEVTKLKRRLEENAQSQPAPSKCARIPRSLSVSSSSALQLTQH